MDKRRSVSLVQIPREFRVLIDGERERLGLFTISETMHRILTKYFGPQIYGAPVPTAPLVLEVSEPAPPIISTTKKMPKSRLKLSKAKVKDKKTIIPSEPPNEPVVEVKEETKDVKESSRQDLSYLRT